MKLFEHAVHGIIQASLQDGVSAANPRWYECSAGDDPQQVLWSPDDLARHLFAGGFDELEVIRQRLVRARRCSATRRARGGAMAAPSTC